MMSAKRASFLQSHRHPLKRYSTDMLESYVNWFFERPAVGGDSYHKPPEGYIEPERTPHEAQMFYIQLPTDDIVTPGVVRILNARGRHVGWESITLLPIPEHSVNRNRVLRLAVKFEHTF